MAGAKGFSVRRGLEKQLFIRVVVFLYVRIEVCGIRRWNDIRR